MRSHRIRRSAANRFQKRNLLIESLEPRQLLTAAYQNPIDRLDVNDDELITPIDALLVINDINRFGARVLPVNNDATAGFIDVTGDQILTPNDVLQVINHINSKGAGARTPAAGEIFSTEELIAIDLAPTDGARLYRLNIDADFGSTTVSALLPDMISVYVVDRNDSSKTLLDRGQNGTSLFSWSPAKIEIATGLARWDGRTLELDLSSITDKEFADIKIQRLNGELTRRSSFSVGPVETLVDMQRTSSQFRSLLSAPILSMVATSPVKLLIHTLTETALMPWRPVVLQQPMYC